MEFSSFFFHLLFFSLIFQFSNIVSSTKVEIPAQDVPTDKLDSLTGQVDEKDADIGKRLVQQRMKRDNEDVLYIDHRRSNCFDEPRSQGRCFASYAFTTIALYEWLQCKKTGRFQAFSEQYVIDCSYRHQNSGCNGGNPLQAIRFINDCGLALRENYPSLGRIGICPYDRLTPYANMGSLRVDEQSFTFIPLEQIEEYLEYGPIIVIVKISEDFLAYSGGVDDNVDHTPEILLTMLLIGHGTENGKDYWLFRNSYFDTSVGDGYYKLNKNVHCFEGGMGVSGHIPGPI